ncbi:BTAD domain-containing putative transcriptional regulator [Pelagibius marinus]|uniref:BTAD domain-containing putative transcriptional regulator n=1 Tax=Pelagibius marinus TaxID=2762760 RepID=UPI0018733CAC|nr:bacterial transcriptional activator domain-containing protein [Pelagibius marinus]
MSLTLRKTEALIAYLAVNGHSQQREKLATLLWGETTQSNALQSLRQARLTLMRNLEPHKLPILNFDRREVHLDVTSLQVDALEFERLQEAGDQDSLARAVALYSGEFLAGMEIESEAFEEWLLPIRAWYREQMEAALDRLLTLQEQAGAQESSIRTAKRILALDPLREDVHRWMMQAFAAAGQRTSALAAYDACRTVLREQLDVEPEAETESLYQSILLRADPQPRTVKSAGEQRINGTAVASLAAEAPATGEAAAAAGAGGGLAPISNLTNAALEVLQIAAVSGSLFSMGLLEALTERSPERSRASLRELVAAGLFETTADGEASSIGSSVRERVLGQLLPSHRKHLHYAVAVALEDQAGSDIYEQCYEIAGHFRAAGRWNLAVPHLLRLAKLEADRGNLDLAETQVRQASADLELLPPGDARGKLEVKVLVIAAELAELKGDLARAEEILARKWPDLKRYGNSELWISYLLARARLRHRRGMVKQAYAAIRRMPRTCKGRPMQSHWLLAERFADLADKITGEGCNPAMMLESHRLTGPRSSEADASAVQALCHAKREKFSAAYAACAQAIRLSENQPDTTCLTVSLQTQGIIQVWDGEAKVALEAFDRALSLAEARGDLLRQYTSRGYRGFALINAGRAFEAKEELAQAVNMSEKLHLPFMRAMFMAWLAEALQGCGENDRALEVARWAARMANEGNEPWARSVALRVMAQALSVSNAEDGKFVDRILRAALEMQSSLGLPFETARTVDMRAEVSAAELH